MLKHLLVCFSFVLLFSCSPQRRLDRLINKHPELAKIDTVRTLKIFTEPSVSIDTSFAASQAAIGLAGLIDNYRDYLDSVRRLQLTTEITNYITSRECLEDTITIPLKHNGWVKLWQTGKQFYFKLWQPERKISFTIPLTVKQFEVTKRYNWQMFWAGGFCGLLLIIILRIGREYFRIKV